MDAGVVSLGACLRACPPARPPACCDCVLAVALTTTTTADHRPGPLTARPPACSATAVAAAAVQGQGLNERQLALCDSFVYIQQYGAGTASLNVAVAASIVLHHFALWAGYGEREREVGAASWVVRVLWVLGRPQPNLCLQPRALPAANRTANCRRPLLLLLLHARVLPSFLLQGQKYVLDERPSRTAPRGCVPLTPAEQAAERLRRQQAAAEGDADAAALPDLFD